MLLENCQNFQLISKWEVKNYYVETSVVNFGLQLHLLKKFQYGFVITQCIHLYTFYIIQFTQPKHVY